MNIIFDRINFDIAFNMNFFFFLDLNYIINDNLFFFLNLDNIVELIIRLSAIFLYIINSKVYRYICERYIFEFIKILINNVDIKIISIYKRKFKIEIKKKMRRNYQKILITKIESDA